MTSPAALLKPLRDAQFALLYPGPGSVPATAVDRLANAFSRYAGTNQTAFDSGAVRTTAVGGVNILERQVERAFAQVLGRAPGRGTAELYQRAHRGVSARLHRRRFAIPFPKHDPDVRQRWLRHGTRRAPGDLRRFVRSAFRDQASLHRQASVIATDALRALDTIQSFSNLAESERVEALRARFAPKSKASSTKWDALTTAPERINAYFAALLGPVQCQRSQPLWAASTRSTPPSLAQLCPTKPRSRSSNCSRIT